MAVERPALGRLERIADVRAAWPGEATDFTPWLAQADNVALLGEAIGLQLDVVAREKNVGPFRADILCKDASDHYVLIENQLEITDHAHLGQLLTYAAGLEAVTIIWIAKRFTEEHRAALDWLNKSTGQGINFFGIEIELWRIGTSPMAPKFNIVSKPNDWSKVVRGEALGSSTEGLHFQFWTQFGQYLEEHKSPIRMSRPSHQALSNVILGPSLFRLIPWRLLRDNRIGVWVRFRGPDPKGLYERVEERYRQHVEERLSALGPVAWLPETDRRESTIELNRPPGATQPESLEELNQWMARALETLQPLFSEITATMDAEGLGGEAPPNADADLSDTPETPGE